MHGEWGKDAEGRGVQSQKGWCKGKRKKTVWEHRSPRPQRWAGTRLHSSRARWQLPCEGPTVQGRLARGCKTSTWALGNRSPAAARARGLQNCREARGARASFTQPAFPGQAAPQTLAPAGPWQEGTLPFQLPAAARSQRSLAQPPPCGTKRKSRLTLEQGRRCKVCWLRRKPTRDLPRSLQVGVSSFPREGSESLG